MSQPAPEAVVVEGLTRRFNTGKGFRKRSAEVTALAGVSLTVHPNEVLGLLGPNGAGKTTFVKVLATVLLPSSGRAAVFGHDVVTDTAAVRTRIGIVLGGERGLYGRLTPRQNLRYWAALYHLDPRVGHRRADELLERVGLTEHADLRVETFSRGMKQRLHLARGLIGDPALLFLDEPTTGMDPVATAEFRTLMSELREEGRTILLATHDMAEAEALCDRVALIDRGEMLAIESPRKLSAWIAAFERVDATGVDVATLDEIRRLPGVASVEPAGEGFRIQTEAENATAEVLRRLVAGGVESISTSRPSLEEVYLHVFGARGMRV